MKPSKVLLVGSGRYEIYEKAFLSPFRSFGVETELFGWETAAPLSLWGKVQNKLVYGPAIDRINDAVYRNAAKFSPDLVFFYKPFNIYPETVKKIGKLGIRTFAYYNDDPFNSLTPWYFTRHFLASLPHYDWVFSYRPANVENYKRLGCGNVSLLMPYFIKERDFVAEGRRELYDAIFAGHFEEDGRDRAIKALMDLGIRLKLHGTSWDRSSYYPYFKQKLGDITRLDSSAYNSAINSSRIALAFLSKLNNDVYTRRCFEIPATKTFMLCEYSKELSEIFIEGVEAEYFRNVDELLAKTRYYLANEEARKRIAEAGYEKLVCQGHEAKDRVRQIIDVYAGNF